MRSRPATHYLGLALAIGLLVLLPGAVTAQPAPNGNSVLVLGSVDGGGVYSAYAASQGFTVVIDSDAQWLARTTADFATFRALILGDPTCGGIPPVAQTNAAVWGPATDGPILIIGTDEHFHYFQGGQQLIESGIDYTTSGTATETGAYISLSCYYDSAPPLTPVLMLSAYGTFQVEGAMCHNDIHVVAVHPALAGSTDATLSNWFCSDHNFFNSFPNTFIPLAIAENATGVGQMTFADGTTGIPYILARGGGISPINCGNNVLEPPEQCDDGNTVDGDGCSSFCTLEGVPAASFGTLALLGVLLMGGLGWVVLRRLHS